MINIDSIVQKTKKYANSTACKEKVQQLREQAFDKNQKFGKQLNQDGIISKNNYSDNAKKYLDILKLYAVSQPEVSDGLSEIIQQTVNHATISRPEKVGKGMYKVSIEFDHELLRRESIVGYYTGEYIENILALFNNGMDIKNGEPPIGYWDSHGIRIRATAHRDALRFMQNTVDEFMKLNKKRFDIKSADIGDIYKQ